MRSLLLVLDAVARLHAMPWAEYRATTPDWDWPWCPLPERLLLLSRPSAERYRAEGLAVGERFLAGWDAFDRLAPQPARDADRSAVVDPTPLLAALGRLPTTGLHGDLKLANVAPLDDGRVALIDWQMMSLAPVAVELGWLLVSNSSSLRLTPDEVMAAYHDAAARAAGASLPMGRTWLAGPSSGPDMERDPDRLPPRGLAATIGDWDAQLDLTWIVGLLLRGWRKGLDAEAGATLPSGVSAGRSRLVVASMPSRPPTVASDAPLGCRSNDERRTPSHAQDRPDLPGIEPSTYPFSQVVEANGFVFLAGQVGDAPGAHGAVPGGIGAETRAMLDNVGRLLDAVGLDYADVVRCTVYLRDFSDFDAMNAVYRTYFPTEPPARATVGVTALAEDYSVEIEVTAAR